MFAQREAMGQPGHVGVDGQPRQAEAHAANDVARLAADTGQGHEVLERRGTSPPKRSTTAPAMPIRLFVLFW